MREYLIKWMTQVVDRYLEEKIFEKDEADGLSDFIHKLIKEEEGV